MNKDVIKKWGLYEYPSESIIRISKRLFTEKSTILDFGCGGGRHFLYLNKTHNAYACDKYIELVNYVKSKTDESHKVFLYKDEFLLEDNSLDGILVCGVFEYMSKKETAIFFKEAKRCLKPDGSILITLTESSTKPTFEHEYTDFDDVQNNKVFLSNLKNLKIGYEDFEFDTMKLKRYILTGQIK